MKKPELCYCPFCSSWAGGARAYQKLYGRCWAVVVCPDCGARGPKVEGFATKAEAKAKAIELWQSRALTG